MNLRLTLTPEIENKLKEQTAREGKPLESIALEALEEKLSTDEPSVEMLPPSQWQQRFRAFLGSLPQSTATFVDDSGESIYEGRGE